MTTALNFLTNGQTNQPVTLYGNSATTGPQWMQDYTQGLIAQSNAIASQPFPQYSGTMVAPFSDAQNQSFKTVQDLQGRYQPGLNTASSMAQGAANPGILQGAGGYLPQAQSLLTPGAIQQYLNPYIGDVVNASENMTNTNFVNNVLPQLNSGFIQGGNFGSAANRRMDELAANQLREQEQLNAGSILGQGYGLAQQGALGAASQTGALGQIAGGLGYEQGVLGLQGANQLGALSSLGQNLGLQGATALNAVGNQQQSLAQRSADTAYNQFLQQQQYPREQATWLGSQIRGLASPYTSGAATQQAYQQLPSYNQMGPSPLSSALGMYSGLTGLANMFGSGGGGGGPQGPYYDSSTGSTVMDPYGTSGMNFGGSQTYDPNQGFTGVNLNPPTTDQSMNFGGSSSYDPYNPDTSIGEFNGSGISRGGPIRFRRGGALSFAGADGQAVKRFGIGGINWDTSGPSDIAGIKWDTPALSPETFPTFSWDAGAPWNSLASPPASHPSGNESFPAIAGTIGALGALGSGHSGSGESSTAQDIGAGLGDVNAAARLYNTGSKLSGGTGLSGTPLGSALGTANDIYGIYGAIAHPGVATGLSGASGALDLYDKATGSVPGVFGTGLGALGAGAGIYSAIKNPSPLNVASGIYDAYKLYNIASPIISSLTGSGAAGAGAGAAEAGAGAAEGAAGGAGAGTGSALAGAGMGAGALAAWYFLQDYLTRMNAPKPLEEAKMMSPELQATDQSLRAQGAPIDVDRAVQAAAGVKPVTPFTGNTQGQGLDWLRQTFGNGAGSSSATANRGQV